MSRPKRNSLNVRVDNDLFEAVDRLAKRTGQTRSSAIRVLLATALGDPPLEVQSREVLIALTEIRKIAVRRLAAELNDRLPTILEETIAANPEL